MGLLPSTQEPCPSCQPAPQLQLQLLSNGSYHVAVTRAGSGYSAWKGLALTRWRE
ncbi:MAG: hypothetical protein KA752_12280, partial [Giesbergeria sp.]|nr:hypothetical protein [Giesbergeria sp.]